MRRVFRMSVSYRAHDYPLRTALTSFDPAPPRPDLERDGAAPTVLISPCDRTPVSSPVRVVPGTRPVRFVLLLTSSELSLGPRAVARSLVHINRSIIPG